MKIWKSGVLCLLFSMFAVLSIVIEPPSRTYLVAFKTPSGISGEIKLQIPAYVISGIQARILVNIDFYEGKYSDNSLSLISRFETGIEEVDPRGLSEFKINPLESVAFEWKIKPGLKAVYPGNIWLFVDCNGHKELLLSREILINSIDMLGLDSKILLFLGGGTGVIGILLILKGIKKR